MKSIKIMKLGVAIGLVALLHSTDALAIADNAVLQSVIDAFKDKASAWEEVVMSAASFLFWTLGAISLAWKMGQLVLTKADIGDFYAELFRFSITFGLFFWLLKNATSGENIAGTIISSLQQLGKEASGTTGLTPSSLIEMGLVLFGATLAHATFSLISLVNAIVAIVILIILSAIAINMMILLISQWFLLYAGIFFLGFGGSSWTSDMAINYFKTVLGVGVQLFAMLLVAGVGISLISTQYPELQNTTPEASASLIPTSDSLSVLLVLCMALWMLSSKIPPLLAGIITGSGTGGIGNVGASSIAGAAMAGAAMGAAMTAAAGSGMLSGAANVAGMKDAYNAATSGGSTGAGGDGDGGGSLPSTADKGRATMDAPSLGDNDTGSSSSSSSQSASSRIANAVKSMAKDKKDEIVGNTFGGKIASSIRATDTAALAAAAAEEDGDGGTLSAANEQPSQPDQSEIDAFVNKT